MKKKVVSLMLVGAMFAGLLAGCGSSGGSSSTGGDSAGATEEASSEESVELKMVMISMGTNLEDAEKVEEAINEYIEPKINATVDIEWLDMGDYSNQLNLKLTSGEEIDILPTFEIYVSTLYAQDALMDITDLVAEYGSDIVEAVGEDYMQAGYINGALYRIPCLQSFAKHSAFFYRTDLAEQYNLDFSNVSSLEDLESILATVHEADPNLTVLIQNNPTTSMLTRWDWDILGDEYGVLMDAENSTEVTNLFETDEYKELVTLMHEWYEAGYIQTDASTTSDNIATLLGSGNAFGVILKSYPGYVENQTLSVGYELGSVTLTDALSTTSDVTDGVITVPSTSTHPEKAVEFINLLYSDSTLINLLYYGIEGEHYQVADEEVGRVDYLDGEDITTCKYVNKMKIGNQLIGLIESTAPATVNEDILTYNETATKSKALGFTYDSSPVANELAALDTVAAKYRKGLECGSLDPETELPKFIEELKAAGIDTVIAEKQSQLDAWLEENSAQ